MRMLNFFLITEKKKLLGSNLCSINSIVVLECGGQAVVLFYTVVKHDGHLRTVGKSRKDEPQASIFYISRMFSNVRSVLSQCNKRLRLLHLLYDIDFTRAKQ